MLSYRRSFEMPRIGVAFVVADYAHPDFRLRIEQGRGFTVDEQLSFPAITWSGYGDRPRLDVVLRGDVRDRENGVTRRLGAGSFAIGRALDSLYMRASAREQELLCLSIEWNLGSLGTSAPVGLPDGTLSASSLEELTRASQALLAPAPRAEAVGILARILARLRADGLPFDTWRARDLASPAAPAHQRVADAVGRALSRLDAKPSLADLQAELGLSRRRVGDLVGEVSTRYGLNGSDWRSLRDRWRLSSAVLAMSNAEARTEDVAAAVGYGSANALCQAFNDASLPSPRLVRGALDRLE